jgi:hypothetical protein
MNTIPQYQPDGYCERVPDEVRAAIRTLYANNEKIVYIATLTGVSPQTVSKIARQAGMLRRQRVGGDFKTIKP